ncbi:MAG TPA: FlgO family outer membrane protein [Pyrinomonadaceae bacterium]|nr:FlgO family outer membrane protein [Pyrinomonadaceae bacterium]
MSTELLANTTLSHYRIISKLGEGGMGEVYLAQDTSELARTVALKIVPAEVAKDKDRLQRFTQEARTVSNLNHPNILTVYEFGQADSVSFIATEYIDGVTLRKHLSGRRTKLIDILDLATQIVAALNAAHEAGITHRDLKPENVMVRKDHIVKVLDFGLAKLSETSPQGQIDSEAGTKVFVQTEPGVVMGTVSYMSPEQSAGKLVDHRSDIWSVGVVLYEMIAGVVPFQGKDIHRQIIVIQETDPLALSQLVEGVPDRLEEIVGKCLAKERDERYQTAKDLLIDLRNLRRKLDVDAEIERTVAPEFRTTSGAASRDSTEGTETDSSGATIASSAHPTSSAEYLVTGIKQHKTAVFIVILVLVAGIIGSGLYWRARNSSGGAINSIAVLPFQNRSSDADSEYLSDGLAESLIYRLSQLPNLKVSPTSAVMRYKGKEVDTQKIAAELGVQAVLSGRMTQRGENLSISVELVDAANNKIIWGEQYERKMSDLLATQREIATTITEKLQMKLSGEGARGITKEYTDSNEAYRLYLKGRFQWNKRTIESLKQAVEYYNQAIGKDPTFALAYSGLAETYVLFPNYDVASAKDSMPQAKAAALRALELDDSLAEAHTALGWYLMSFEYDWAGGERELRRAIELNPNYATAHQWLGELLGQMKRFDEADVEKKRALELDPLSPIISFNIGWQLFVTRRYDEALREFQRTATLYPDFALATSGLCWGYFAKGALDQAVPACRKNLELIPDAFNKGHLSLVLGRAGQREEARKLLDELKRESLRRDVPSMALAMAHLGLNEKEEALQMLEKEVDERGYWASTLAVAPEVDELRSEPRFKALLKRMNLPE